MNPFIKIAELFEHWVDPFKTAKDLRPPDQLMQFIWFYARQARWPYLAVIITSGMVALIEAGFFFYIGRLVDVLDQADPEQGWPALMAVHGGELLFVVIAVLGGRLLFTTINGLIEEQTLGRSFDNLVRWQAYAHISRQSVAFFSNDFAGRLVTKVSQAASALHGVLSDLIQVVWFTAIYVGTTAFLFGGLDWRMLALIIVWLTCFGLLAWFFVPRIRKLAVATAEAGAVTNGRIVDSISNIQTLKLFGSSEQSDSFVKQGFEQFLGTTTRLGRMVIAVRASMLTLSSTMLFFFGVLCIDLWTRGDITVGAIAFSLSLVLRLNMMLGRFMGHLNGLMRNFGVLQNSMETISEPIGIVDAPDAKELQPGAGHIKFENVSFRYVERNEVIDNFSLDIAAGEKVGLIGRSGAGKSTLVNLLLRFYDLDSGAIIIDDQNIASVSQDSLRRSIGVVTQDTSLLHRSIRDNIKYGRVGASEDEMIAAAKQAEAHEFILGLEDRDGRIGYDAHVGERGVKLSGGQRQRVAIARVLLKDAPILVLDEATSALDSEVEAAIQSQLTSLMQGKTAIAIAHRLSTIAALDRLIVIDGGRIIEQGSHQHLLDIGGHYAALWKRQSGGFLLQPEPPQE